jgi:hypothetical protein
MRSLSVAEMIPILQTAIGPVILISGVGLLLLTMTNRFGRIIDRARNIAARVAASPDAPHERDHAQIAVLWRQAGLIRLAISLATGSALCAALLIVLLFLTALLRLQDAWLIGTLFALAMGSLVASLILFLSDVNRSLNAIRLELEAVAKKPIAQRGSGIARSGGEERVAPRGP